MKKFLREGREYREIFSTGQLNEQDVLSRNLNNYPNYQSKCIIGFNQELPIIDFMIANNEQVLLSHISNKGGTPTTYLFIKSKTVVEFYTGLFNDCWNVACVPKMTPTDHS